MVRVENSDIPSIYMYSRRDSRSNGMVASDPIPNSMSDAARNDYSAEARVPHSKDADPNSSAGNPS